MYKSPIEQFVSDIQLLYEEEAIKAVQQVGFNVEKEELITALSYDRGQYEKGYEDGKRDAVEHGRWIETEFPYGCKQYRCSICIDDEWWNGKFAYGDEHYCPNCGAKMDEVIE